MLEDKELKAINKILPIYNKIENDLLIKIAQHFLFNEEFLNSDYWRIKKLEELGLFNDEVIKYIASYSKTSQNAVKQALNELGIDTYNLPKLKRAFEDEQLSINPKLLLENGTIQALIDKQYLELNNRLIDLSYKINRSVRNTYLNIVEETYLKTSLGTHSYQEAIRESINKLSNQGLKILTYTTTDDLTGEVIGIRNYTIEGAVRREILTNTRNLSNEINKRVIDDLQPEYVKASEHIDCRPSHFSWQGTIMKAEEWESITDYGEVDGLGGINCKHYVEPYFGDNRGKEEKQFTEKDCKKAYTIQQKQRYLERGVSSWKRKVNLYKANGDLEAMKKSKTKLNMWLDKLHEFSDKNDIKVNYTNIYTKIKSKH